MWKCGQGCFIKIEGKMHHNDNTILNVYVPNSGVPSFIKQIFVDIEHQVNPNTLILGDLNTSLSPTNR